jgi:signal transduction histidine kinase
LDQDLDETFGEIPMVAESFSRMVLNLCNNAFDVMREKRIKNSELKIKTEGGNGSVFVISLPTV